MLRGLRRLLLLGSTVEALAIGQALAGAGALGRRVEVIAARARDRDLATEIRRPPPAVEQRASFDGPEGMAEAMRWDRIDLVVDASHPIEVDATETARRACAATGTPLLRIERPPWRPEPGDRWTSVPDLATAAQRLPFFARAFLATGRDALFAFRERRDLWFLGRVHAPTAGRFPLPRGDYAIGRPPFTEAHERTLLEDYRISWVALFNVGGPIGRPLLDAARANGAQVMMIDRPRPDARIDARIDAGHESAAVGAAEEALDWIARRMR